jgi:hypothetical protein
MDDIDCPHRLRDTIAVAPRLALRWGRRARVTLRSRRRRTAVATATIRIGGAQKRDSLGVRPPLIVPLPACDSAAPGQQSYGSAWRLDTNTQIHVIVLFYASWHVGGTRLLAADALVIRALSSSCHGEESEWRFVEAFRLRANPDLFGTA